MKWTLGVGAVAAAGVSVGFLVAGLGSRDQLRSKPLKTADLMLATGFTAAEAERLAVQSNSQLTFSLVGAIVAGVFTVAAIYFFATDGP